VTLLEREDQPGYHTTGRSAALFTETYGNASVRAFTRASRAFFESPPAGFAGSPLLSPRGHLVFARADRADMPEATAAEYAAIGAVIERLSGAQVRAMVPALREQSAHAGIIDRAASDMDVNAIHRGFLRGVDLVSNAELRRAEFIAGRWRVDTPRRIPGLPSRPAWPRCVRSLPALATRSRGSMCCQRTQAPWKRRRIAVPPTKSKAAFASCSPRRNPPRRILWPKCWGEQRT